MSNSISYCTTCKGRLWQLKETLFLNLAAIRSSNNIDLILLDYQSNDGLKDYVFRNFMKDLDTGNLKYFELMGQHDYFDMSYAKNVAHCLGTGRVLFNLDADNFIGDTVHELQQLNENAILLPKMGKSLDSGRFGRIGIHASNYHKIRGYNEAIRNMGGDDADFTHRAMLAGIKPIYSNDLSDAISNSYDEKHKFSNPKIPQIRKSYTSANLDRYGIGIVKDHRGKSIMTGYK